MRALDLICTGLSLCVLSTNFSFAHQQMSLDFEDLKDSRGMSCCNDKDCHVEPESVVDYSNFDEGYVKVMVRFGSAERQVKVYRENIIEPPPGLPDGSVVVCNQGFMVNCLALPIPATQ